MWGRGLSLIGTACATLALGATPALADHHLIQIREVYPGNTADPDIEFVEIQMFASGQGNLDEAARLDIYGADGQVNASFDNLLDAPFDDNQRTFLFGDNPFGVSGNYGYESDEMDPAGGAVCFNSTTFGSIDCVAWGAIADAPAGTGTPEAAIPNGSSLNRSIARRCPTLLEAADDTNSSAADFSPLATPTPRANETAPIERACPNTRFTKKPDKETTKRRAVFKFTASPAAESFECKLDSRPFRACSSPFRKRVRIGRHRFKVRAANELAPAVHRWKRVRPE